MKPTDSDTAAEEFHPVKSALRTVEVVDVISKSPQGLTFAEILDVTGWPRSSTYNLLLTLSSTRFVEFDPEDRRYRVGIRLWEAARSFGPERELARIAMPGLEDAKSELNETVQLAILDGVENVYVAKVEADHHLKLVSEVGSRLPAHATGLGKALLASLPPEEVRRRFAGIELVAYTPQTITDLDALEAELELVRSRGYAVDQSEYTVGVYCIAVGIRGRDGETVAAISASVPEARIDQDLEQRMVKTLRANADRISQALGYPERP